MASRRTRIERPSPFDDDRPRTMQEAADIIYADPDKLAELDRIQVRREMLRLDQIRLDGGTQPRAQLDDALIDEYAEEMRNGAEFPRGEVTYDGEHYWLTSGFHRYHARQRAGFEDMAVNVHQGTQRDAQLASVGENAAHGLRRTNDDKRRAVMLLLRDAEWGQWSDRKIAEKTRTSHPFVAKLREEVTGNFSSEVVSLTSDNSETRTYTTKHGTTATMNTQRIRESNRQRTQDPKSANFADLPSSMTSTGEPEADSPSPDPATDAQIQAEILSALDGADLAWHELLREVAAVLGGEIESEQFNAVLRALIDSGLVGSSTADQAAYALVRDQEVVRSEKISDLGGDAGDPELYRGMLKAAIDATAALIVLRNVRDWRALAGEDRRSLRQLEERLTGLLFQMGQTRDPLMDLRDAVGRLSRGRQL